MLAQQAGGSVRKLAAGHCTARSAIGGASGTAAGILAVALAVFLISPSAAQPIPQIGVLQWTGCDEPDLREVYGPFLDGLAAHGYEPGKTIQIECRGADANYDGLRTAASALAALPIDVIVAHSQPSAVAAREATSTIPIISIISGDPVGAGLARSLAEPGGNLTGVTYYATELTGKRLELLREMLPGLATVGVINNPEGGDLPFEADTKVAAERLGLDLRIEIVTRPADLPMSFERLRAAGAEAVFILPDLMFGSEPGLISTLALEHRLPCMAWGEWFAQAGCLMAYSSDYATMIRRLADYVDRILDGANPAELPIEHPTTLLLSINLDTADALGLEVPDSLLVLADKIIE